MRFPAAEQLQLPCRFVREVPGALHPDGRRYLPLIVLELPAPVDSQPALSPNATQIGVVDRHHVVDLALVGQAGSAQLVLLLSMLRMQAAPYQQGFVPEVGLPAGRISTIPRAFGRVVKVLTWELKRGHLPYESLYTELLLDIGIGVVGVRTTTTAPDIAQALGTAQIVPGDWLDVSRSRIDILGFSPDGEAR